MHLDLHTRCTLSYDGCKQLQQPQHPRPASLTKPVELLGELDLEAERLLARRVHAAEQKPDISLDAAARLLMKARQGYQQVVCLPCLLDPPLSLRSCMKHQTISKPMKNCSQFGELKDMHTLHGSILLLGEPLACIGGKFHDISWSR
jgi:hypothetical protein